MTGHIPRNYAPRNGSARATAEAAFRKFTAKSDAKGIVRLSSRNPKGVETPRQNIPADKKV